MTKEEAIRELKSLEYYGRPFDNSEMEDKKGEALFIAIKALEQESCKDVIDINAVIEWLKNKDIIKLFSQEEIARKELKELSFVTPKTDWIPASPAKWKRAYYEYMPYLYCSNCKLKVGLYESTNYCPNCGTKMEGGLNK